MNSLRLACAAIAFSVAALPAVAASSLGEARGPSSSSALLPTRFPGTFPSDRPDPRAKSRGAQSRPHQPRRPRRSGGMPFGDRAYGQIAQCAVQTMHGSKERTTCWIAGALAPAAPTSDPASACSSGPGVPPASRGEKFQVVGATI